MGQVTNSVSLDGESRSLGFISKGLSLSAQLDRDAPVVIVGGGLAGLACANQLDKLKIEYVLLESTNRLGGRVGSEKIDNFTIDIGFQSYQESYPEGRRILDSVSLELTRFYRGIYVQGESDKQTRFLLSDPRQYPGAVAELLATKLVGASDIICFLKLIPALSTRARRRLALNKPTKEFLADIGANSSLFKTVIEPFLSGVFIEDELETPASMTKFLLERLYSGPTSIPLSGMQMIPDQLAKQIKGEVRLGQRVSSISKKIVKLDDGSAVPASEVVLATELSTANDLLRLGLTGQLSKSVGYFYFLSERRPLEHPAVFTPSRKLGPILTIATISDVAQSYLPKSSKGSDVHLVSVSTLTTGDNGRQLPVEETYRELASLFGPEVAEWRELAAGVIPDALPKQFGRAVIPNGNPEIADGIFICGDYTDTPSINGALFSGRRAAIALADQRSSSTSHFSPLIGG